MNNIGILETGTMVTGSTANVACSKCQINEARQTLDTGKHIFMICDPCADLIKKYKEQNDRARLALYEQNMRDRSRADTSYTERKEDIESSPHKPEIIRRAAACANKYNGTLRKGGQ